MTPQLAPNRRILVIDDNLDIHDDFRKILVEVDDLGAAEARLFGRPEPARFDVQFAQQGEEALALVQQALTRGQPYAMAFVDVRMPPGWDGIETTHRLCEADPDLQVVICTAHADYSWDEIVANVGSPLERFLILKKPFDPIEVVQLAHALTDKWRLLQESRRTLTDVIDSLPGVFYIVDEQGRLKGWNQNLERVSGYSGQELSERSLADLFAGADGTLDLQALLGSLESGMQMADVVLRAKSRAPIPYVVSGRSGWVAGKPSVIGLGLDVSALKQAEAELRLKGAALNAAASAMAISDSDGTIVWVNGAFSALTGYESSDIVGRSFRMLKSGVHPPTFYERLWTTVQSGRVWRGEITNRRKDGTLYPEEMVITPVIDAEGITTHFIVIKQDLTERKRLQTELMQAQRMEVVGRLAGGIAHDFNNLLTVINGVAELAGASVKEDDPVAADLREIHRAGSQAAALTRQLLAFSRKQVLSLDVLSLTALVEGMRGMLQRILGEDIRLLGPGNCAGMVKVDQGQLQQVIMNLAENARDAMPAGGTVTIEVQDLPAATGGEPSTAAPRVRMTVTDTGIGMDEHTKSHLFEPFFTTKPFGKGSGLGLATVEGIVKQSGGTLSVTSTPGCGSTFTIELPGVEGAEGEAVLDPPASTPRRAGETILIVDDEELVRRLAARVLTSSGYTVMAAAGGHEALDLLAHHTGPVDLLLTDVVMPSMSGPELAARCAITWPRMKVLFTSGHTDNPLLNQSVFSREANFIGKPYTIDALTSRVREVLNQADVVAP